MKINRKDTLDFKEKILRLTPQDRKKIGINKSTLVSKEKSCIKRKNKEQIRYALAEEGKNSIIGILDYFRIYKNKKPFNQSPKS